MHLTFSCLSLIVYSQNKSNPDSLKNKFIITRICAPSYPKKAEQNNIEGNVIVQFDIDSSCSFINIKIIKGLGYECDEEAIKAVRCGGIQKNNYDGKCKPQSNIQVTVKFVKPEE